MSDETARRILVTGALGQIGTELVPALRARFGDDAVVATDIKELDGALGADTAAAGLYERVDVTKPKQLADVVERYDVGTVYHLAALLSAVAEAHPQRAWSLNMGGLIDVLELARERSLAVFVPSSIAAFGPGMPDPTPQIAPQRPTSMYGVTKVAGELLCDYYHDHFGVDVRGVRYPGLISSTAPPGGGTTDYAVHIFHAAVRDGHYTCFLREDTRLDMMYMPDAIRAAIDLMTADGARLPLGHRNAYNVTSFSVTPAELADAIRRHLPEFTIDYAVDPMRQRIADSWPDRLDHRAAQTDWGWRPAYDLDSLVADMMRALGA
ncbi:MAG: NAD-dependent epimerase/dehydratase family protein [Acidobacteriota bacterium]